MGEDSPVILKIIIMMMMIKVPRVLTGAYKYLQIEFAK